MICEAHKFNFFCAFPFLSILFAFKIRFYSQTSINYVITLVRFLKQIEISLEKY